MSYLYAAYVLTWLIHIGYFSILAARYARLKREIQGMESK